MRSRLAAKSLGVRNLTTEQLGDVCEIADRAVRDFVFSKVKPRLVEDLEVAVDAEGSGPVTIVVDVSLSLKPSAGRIDVKRLVDEAGERAVQAVEDKLREISCKSTS
jgi:hypothetical protein